ncbi:hypothetical protein OPQ81_005692 [Rhizoctonia solani]|nr:hypothetical protein OPQ81_005692 [Rhizoctonia solani]
MTLSGIFGIVAESLVGQGSRWWSSTAFAMQMLAILVAQLAAIQLLTPDCLFTLLSINAPVNALPSWRIYTLISLSLLASVTSIISGFVMSRAPSLPSSLPTLVSLSLPLPVIFSLARIAKVTRSSIQFKSRVETIYATQNFKCADLELSTAGVPSPSTALRFPRIWAFVSALQCIAVLSAVGEVVEGALAHRAPVIRLLSAMGFITWGGGVMIIHFIIIYESMHRPPVVPSASVESSPRPVHDLERVSDQPSEDFMTLKDPFASPTQVGYPLPPSPPRAVPRRSPRRRASEPLQLRRFGSFATLAEDVKERQAGNEEDQHTQLLEELIRHAWFNTKWTNSDFMRNNPHEYGAPPSILTPIQMEGDVFTIVPGICASGSSTPTIKQEPVGGLEMVSPSVLPFHVTPPHPVHRPPWTPHQRPGSPEPPKLFPLSLPSSLTSGCSPPPSASAFSSACIEPPCPRNSDSGSSFISPPPTPTLRASRQYSWRKAPSPASLGFPDQQHSSNCL